MDDDIDLNDKEVLNSVLHHLNSEEKAKVSNSFKYTIFEYDVTKKDYAKVITYFSLMLVLLILFVIGLCLRKNGSFATILVSIGGGGFIFTLCSLILPISWIKQIREGGNGYQCGSLSQTHLVLIDWSDAQFDRTIYVPLSEVERLSIGKDSKKAHGTVLVYLKGRVKPIQTLEITNPEKLIDVFNNLDSYVKNCKIQGAIE